MTIAPERSHATVGATLRIRVFAPAENANPWSEVIPVVLTSSSDSENLALYERMGYREYDRRPVGGGRDLVFLRKRLG